MAEYSKLVITSKGQALMAKMIAGTGNIEFIKVCASDTTYTESQLEALTALTNIKQTVLVSKVTRTNEVAIQVEAAFTNTELTTGYYMRALGLYAVDPDVGEILYAVTIESSGNCYMPAYNGITVSGAYVQLVTTVGNAENVTLEVDVAAIATIGNIQDLQNQITNMQSVETFVHTGTLSELPEILTSFGITEMYGHAIEGESFDFLDKTFDDFCVIKRNKILEIQFRIKGTYISSSDSYNWGSTKLIGFIFSEAKERFISISSKGLSGSIKSKNTSMSCYFKDTSSEYPGISLSDSVNVKIVEI